jgi:hypothetical protein
MKLHVRKLARPVWMILLVAIASCGPDAPADSESGRGITGELEVFAVDYEDGSSEMRYFLHISEAEELELELDVDDPPPLSTGDRVEVHGRAHGDVFAVAAIRLVGTDDDVGSSALGLTGNGVERQSRAVALLVHWGNQDNLTPEAMRSRLFNASNSTAQWNHENSFNLLETTGDAYGWFRIAAPSGCDYRTIASRARAAAADAGINLNAYTNILYYFPRTTGCGWSGLASVGRPMSPAQDSWYNGSAGCVVLAHELLHNYGARHSRSYQCSGGRSIAGQSSCTYSEYGDRFDVMGGGCFHTNNYQKAAQGWFGGCNTVTVNGNGTFDVAPTQTASDGIQALRIPMGSGLCPSGMSSCYYTVEYRQPVGSIEGGYSSSSHVYRGVLVHVAPPADFSGGSRPSNPYLLDMHPSTSTFNDAALLAGETFLDPNGVRIHVVSADAQSARVQIELPGGGSGGAVCIDGSTPGDVAPPDSTPPEVTLLSPADGATQEPQSTVAVSARVTDDVGVQAAELIWTNGNTTFREDCATAQSPFSCTRSGDTYTWTGQLGGEGPRTWRVRATDTSGNVSTSAIRTIHVTDTPPPSDEPPVVEHLSPPSGATLSANSTIDVSARVSSAAGVDRAELIWWYNGSTVTLDCATASGAASCIQSGDTYTWSLRVGGGDARYWHVRGTDTEGRQTSSGWSLIRLE